ncbi:MAG: carbohydrate-binding domain-containing protein [Lachnospiraceae bacterium]|nr:carbohydrate-binding domain-containing protein [Lachnospiraceae bacterium]
MRKTFKTGLVYVGIAAMLAGCGQSAATTATTAAATAAETTVEATEASSEASIVEGAVNIVLSDDGITVDGEAISESAEDAVYAANDIVYYEEGKDFKYGEGTEDDEHSKEEADAHTVVHITKPGTYAVSGKISAGQIAIDLGEDAEEDPEAVVTLILNGVDINCSVAPGVIFYNVYECGTKDEETASNNVDTTEAGANVVIADGTVNNVNGSYVARIYKSIELNEAGTEVVDSKKLHKYDAAFYSKMSMNMNGGEEGTGVLNISAENEGLDSELHLTLNGGNINIVSGNDGINTNEDYISVTTVNGGTLNIQVDGSTGEGDGIDSNGWLVINGGTVIAEACSFSGDAGIDSDMGIHINGGTVIATGNMLDHISDSEQNYAVFNFADRQGGGEEITLKDADGNVVISCAPENDFTYLIFSDEALADGTYTLWAGETQLAGSAGEGRMGGFGDGMMGGRPEMPEDFDPENMPEGFDPKNMPEGFDPENMPEGFAPENMPEGFAPENMPEGMTPPERPEGAGAENQPADGSTAEPPAMPEGGNQGQRPQGGGGRPGGGRGGRGEMAAAEASTDFAIAAGGSYFSFVGAEADAK